MKEIEVKILEINVQEVREKLLALGAKKVFEGEVDVASFDYPDQRLLKAGEILRVRKVGDRIELCFKDKKEDSQFKMREETEVTTSAFKDTIVILEKIGLKILFQGKKYRESYQLGKVRFEIDNIPGIPTFVEVEAPTEEQVKEYVERLGFTMEQTSNLSARSLIQTIYNETKTT